MRRAVSTILALWAATAAMAQQSCSNIDYEGNRYALCEVDMARADLRLFLYGPDGTPLGQFSAINRVLAAEGKELGFAMNAGMYHDDRAPVGYYVENGAELMRVVPNAGPGNFGMLPNGIFCIRPGRADVIETRTFLARAPACDYATQSGPMLVIDGVLHPRFLAASDSRYIRNGVGTSADGSRAVFVMSRNRVTFYDFAGLFRDRLRLPNALYFDGNSSRLYAPALGRSDPGFAMGPVVGAVTDRASE